MTPTSIARRPLRSYLLWLVLATLLPGVVGASLLFAHQYQKSRVQVERKTLQTVRALVHSVDNRLLQGQAIGQTLSTLDTLESGDFGSAHRQAREALALAGGGMNMVLRDRSGQQLINTAVDFGVPLPRDPSESMRRIFATGAPMVSNVFTGTVTGRATVGVSVPVRIGTEVRYVLSIGLQPAYFNGIPLCQSHT